MDVFVQWATILSPIIAVLLAWWTSRSGARDTAKQIDALKKLAKIQLETTQIQINKELWEARTRSLQASQKKGDMIEYDHTFNQIGGFAECLRNRDEKNRDISYESEFHSKQAHVLEQYNIRLKELYNQLGGE